MNLSLSLCLRAVAEHGDLAFSEKKAVAGFWAVVDSSKHLHLSSACECPLDSMICVTFEEFDYLHRAATLQIN